MKCIIYAKNSVLDQDIAINRVETQKFWLLIRLDKDRLEQIIVRNLHEYKADPKTNLLTEIQSMLQLTDRLKIGVNGVTHLDVTMKLRFRGIVAVDSSADKATGWNPFWLSEHLKEHCDTVV